MNDLPDNLRDHYRGAGAPWHKETFSCFLNESLPQLLARRLPLSGYAAEPVDDYAWMIRVTVGDASADYQVLAPDEDGVFMVDGWPFVVVPIASNEHLDTAQIKCVGEQLYDYIESRLGEAAEGLPWDEQLLRAWLPLDGWVTAVVTSGKDYEQWASGQHLDTTNGIAMRTHLRRIIIPSAEKVVTPGQYGRVCPFETPEGPNIGHVFSISRGAVIQNSRLEIIDDLPEASLGISASMIPFLEHNEANRVLFGANLIRQAPTPADPEPALVQTGAEPDAPGTWCGRNLLTAYISAGAETYEDAILVSESAARRLGYPGVAGLGDKLANRHGQKGVIGRILPDDEMPHLPDGTPVELVCSFIGLHTRLNFGQIREAVMGRVARAEGAPAIVEPFHAPSQSELKDRLRKAGLPEDGMETLTWGNHGERMDRRSTVGWVYWSRSVYTGERLYAASVIGPPWTAQGDLDYYVFRDLGCFETALETFSTRSVDRPDAEEFVKQVEAGPVEQAPPSSPKFRELVRRLNAAGVIAELNGSGVAFRLGRPAGAVFELAHPVAHPWLADHTLTHIGSLDDLPGFTELAAANEKVRQSLKSSVPESLLQKAAGDLRERVNIFFSSLVTPDSMRMWNRIMFHWRGVLTPGYDLRPDQVGLADNAAWTIFGPLVVRELGDKAEVEQRTSKAANVLDEIMARSWVIVNRAPTLLPTSQIAFHPVRNPEPVIRLHPLVCYLMNGDFDGDQAAVSLPITEAAQKEAGEKLSLAAHLRREPNLFDLALLTHEALWGLAELSVTEDGLKEISEVARVPLAAPGGIVNRESMAAAMRELMRRDGADAVIDALQRLMQRGLEVTRRSGASISPFAQESLGLPEQPAGDNPDEWKAYLEEVADVLQRRNDYSPVDLGPQILAAKSGARGTIERLERLVAPWGLVEDASGRSVPIRHGFSEGLSPEESFACVAGARKGLARLAKSLTEGWEGYALRIEKGPRGFGVLSRAMRASQPGKVIARAAAIGERDPLTDIDARLFVGLRPSG